MTDIHPTAIIDPNAEIGAGVKVGPYSIVGAGVKLGDGVELMSHVVVAGTTSVGAGTRIFPLSQGGLVAWSSRQQSG